MAAHLVAVLLDGDDSLPTHIRLRRFKSDLDEIWEDCSSSNYASIYRIRLRQNFRHLPHRV